MWRFVLVSVDCGEGGVPQVLECLLSHQQVWLTNILYDVPLHSPPTHLGPARGILSTFRPLTSAAAAGGGDVGGRQCTQHRHQNISSI